MAGRILSMIAVPLFAALLISVSVAAANAAELFVYVGSYTAEPSSGRPAAPPAARPGAAARPAPEPSTSKGIYAWRYDESSGRLASLGLVAETANPAHLWASPNGKFLYAVNWQENSARVPPGVSAYAIDPATGALKLLNKQSTAGELPNQVVLDPSGKVAAVVNYRTGNMALLPVNPNGSLGAPFTVEQSMGKPLSPRGDGPHAHGIVFSKDSRWLFEAELGLDRVYSYRLDIAGRKLTPADPPYVTLPAGSGPRRLQLSPDDRVLYVNRQNDGKVSVFSVHDGKLSLIQEIVTDPNGERRRGGTAEIQIDHAGRFLYVSLRGSSMIAVYAVDSASGKLTLLEDIPSGGDSPRNMTISPSGDLLFVANQSSGNVVIFKMNHSTGHLDRLDGEMNVSQAAGVATVKAGH
jgi:6-phosphogluconolactonase